MTTTNDESTLPPLDPEAQARAAIAAASASSASVAGEALGGVDAAALAADLDKAVLPAATPADRVNFILESLDPGRAQRLNGVLDILTGTVKVHGEVGLLALVVASTRIAMDLQAMKAGPVQLSEITLAVADLIAPKVQP